MKPRKASPPGFRKKVKYKSFTLKQAGYRLLEGNKIKIGDKVYSYWKSREILGTVKTLTVKRTVRGYYIYLSVEEETTVKSSLTASGKSVGFDFGLTSFLVASDGCHINLPKLFKKNLKKVRKLSRNFSKNKGKHGSWRSLARLHEKIQNQRQALHWEIARSLVAKYDVLCFETLDLQGMGRRYQKSVHDFGFHGFLSILKYLAGKHGKTVVQISRWHPSSKCCCKCGWKDVDLQVEDRVFHCKGCSSVMDRDDNASQNILSEGLKVLKTGTGKSPVICGGSSS